MRDGLGSHTWVILTMISAFPVDGGLIDIECIVLQTFAKMFRIGAEVCWVSAHGVLSQASWLGGGGKTGFDEEQPGSSEVMTWTSVKGSARDEHAVLPLLHHSQPTAAFLQCLFFFLTSHAIFAFFHAYP